MDVRQLEYFVAVAEELSFTRAAARCHVVQSALSYQIARLERENGVLLFERSSRSVRLAPAGEVLLPRARTVLAEVDLARAELTALAGVLTGRLRLGMIGTADAGRTGRRTSVGSSSTGGIPASRSPSRTPAARAWPTRCATATLDVAFVGLFADQVPPTSCIGCSRWSRWSPSSARTIRSPMRRLRRTRDRAGRAGGRWPVVSRCVPSPDCAVRSTRPSPGPASAGTIAFELGTSDAVVRFVGLGFGAAVVPLSAAVGRTDVVTLRLRDPEAQHPVSLIHRDPGPAAPSARAFIALLEPRDLRL